MEGNGDIVVEIGMSKKKFENKIVLSNRFALVNPGTSSILFLYKDKDIDYLLSFDKQNKINYFIIEDINFVTSDGFKKGDKFEKIINNGGEIMVEDGVCFFAILKSGWYAYLEDINFDIYSKERGSINNLKNSDLKFFYKKRSDDKHFFKKPKEFQDEMKNVRSMYYPITVNGDNFVIMGSENGEEEVENINEKELKEK